MNILPISYLYSKIIKKLRGKSVLNSFIHKTAKVESGTSFINSSLERHSYCGYDCSIFNTSIGSFCSIASDVNIGGVAHPMHFVSTSPVFLSHKDSVKAKFAFHDYLPNIKTNIGHDVWIGEGVYIKAGVEIGTGAVIGMGSIVTKDVPPYAIVAGNSAHLLKKRFSDDIIKKLLASKWWDMDDIELKRCGAFVNDPILFLQMIESK